MLTAFLQSPKAGYIAGLLVGVAILGFMLTLAVAAVYFLLSDKTFSQATATSWVWAVGYLIAVVWTVLYNA